jgi:hypothetical protein
MAVVAPGPRGTVERPSVIAHVTQDIMRLYHNGSFSHLGEAESLVRFGMDFGVPWGVSTSLSTLGERLTDICAPGSVPSS